MNSKPNAKPSSPIRFVSAVTLALVLATTVVAASGHSGIQNTDRATLAIAGTISDSMCGARHAVERGGNPECTRLCVKLGAEYVLAVRNRVYFLSGHRADLDRLAGGNVLVKGRWIGRNTIAIESMTPLSGEAVVRAVSQID